MTSVIPCPDDKCTEFYIIKDTIQSKFNWILGEQPLNEFST